MCECWICSKVFVVSHVDGWQTVWFDTFPNTHRNYLALSTTGESEQFCYIRLMFVHIRFVWCAWTTLKFTGNWNRSTLSTMKTLLDDHNRIIGEAAIAKATLTLWKFKSDCYAMYVYESVCGKTRHTEDKRKREMKRKK